MYDYKSMITRVDPKDTTWGWLEGVAEKHGSRIAEEMERQTSELKRQNEELKRQADELKRQAEAHEAMLAQMEKESTVRSHDDRKYFWLGALVSLVTAILVEHGAALLGLLLR